MKTRLLTLIVIIALLTVIGCKKDEPLRAKPTPTLYPTATPVTPTTTATPSITPTASNTPTPTPTLTPTISYFRGPVVISNTLGVTGTFTLDSEAISGPFKYGKALSIAHLGTIAHGMGTTPSFALISPGTAITTGVYISAIGAVSLTIGLTAIEHSPVTVYWFVGK